MSIERDIKDYLTDIQESIRDIKDFVAGMDFARFSSDRKTVNLTTPNPCLNPCEAGEVDLGMGCKQRKSLLVLV